jgi:hypothetical protein
MAAILDSETIAIETGTELEGISTFLVSNKKVVYEGVVLQFLHSSLRNHSCLDLHLKMSTSVPLPRLTKSICPLEYRVLVGLLS